MTSDRLPPRQILFRTCRCGMEGGTGRAGVLSLRFWFNSLSHRSPPQKNVQRKAMSGVTSSGWRLTMPQMLWKEVLLAICQGQQRAPTFIFRNPWGWVQVLRPACLLPLKLAWDTHSWRTRSSLRQECGEIVHLVHFMA